MANPLRPPLTAPGAAMPNPPASPARFNYMDLISAPPPSAKYTDQYMQEADRAAQQIMQNELAQQKMMELERYRQSLSEQNPRYSSMPVSMAANVVATPGFFNDPATTAAYANRTFTAMPEMPSAPMFQVLQDGKYAPDPAYGLAQEVAKARGFDPMGREAAALYGGVVDRIMGERYHDALTARNAYGTPVDSTANYVDMTSPNVSRIPSMTNPNAVNMSQWFNQDREGLRGQGVSAYIPKSLMESAPTPEIYQRDPLTVNIARTKSKRSSE